MKKKIRNEMIVEVIFFDSLSSNRYFYSNMTDQGYASLLATVGGLCAHRLSSRALMIGLLQGEMKRHE